MAEAESRLHRIGALNVSSRAHWKAHATGRAASELSQGVVGRQATDVACFQPRLARFRLHTWEQIATFDSAGKDPCRKCNLTAWCGRCCQPTPQAKLREMEPILLQNALETLLRCCEPRVQQAGGRKIVSERNLSLFSDCGIAVASSELFAIISCEARMAGSVLTERVTGDDPGSVGFERFLHPGPLQGTPGRAGKPES